MYQIRVLVAERIVNPYVDLGAAVLRMSAVIARHGFGISNLQVLHAGPNLPEIISPLESEPQPYPTRNTGKGKRRRW